MGTIHFKPVGLAAEVGRLTSEFFYFTLLALAHKIHAAFA
jgi:hypothetical protein